MVARAPRLPESVLQASTVVPYLRPFEVASWIVLRTPLAIFRAFLPTTRARRRADFVVFL